MFGILSTTVKFTAQSFYSPLPEDGRPSQIAESCPLEAGFEGKTPTKGGILNLKG